MAGRPLIEELKAC